MATRDNYEKLLNAPNVQKMLNLIASAEGVKHGYNTLFGNERLDDLSQHPNVKKEFTQTDGKKNATTAAGRYQFLKDTWDGVAKQFGLKDFSPKNQDIAAVALLAQNGALPSVLKGDFKTAIQKSGSTWASLPSSPYAQPKKSWSDLGIANPAREQYESKASDIVAAYKKKQQEQEAQAQPKVDAGRAQRIVEEYQKARQDGRIKDAATQPQGLPDFDANGTITYEKPQPTPQTPEPSLTDKALGLGETALALGTGTITAPIGSLVGTLGQASREILDGNFGTAQAAENIASAASQTAQDFTYQPRGQVSQSQLQAIGETLSPLESLPPVLGGLGLQAATLGRTSVPQGVAAAQRTAQAVAPVVERAGQAVQRPIQATANAVRGGAQRVGEMVGMRTPEAEGPAPANMGAAQVDQATIRQAMSQELPYPVQLTEGQMTRDPAQLKFEVETSKDPELGAPLRQRQEEQHLGLQQNIDAFIDMTGAKATNMRETGIAVDKALKKQLEADRNRVRVAYAKADKSEEANTPVDMSKPVENIVDQPTTLTDYLNSQVEGSKETIIPTARKLAVHHGLATMDDSGNLVPASPTVKQVNKFRTDINDKIDNLSNPDIRQGSIIKNLVDEHVGPVEGALYKAARIERKRMADHWENRAIIRDLTTKKNGFDDRRVALEDVQKRIIHDGSLDDLRFAKRTLLTSGEEGKQAWRDIQAQTLQEIKSAATSGVAPDAQGNQMISAAALNKAIKRLDDAGKLDYVFGPQGAEKLRAINEISKTLFTTPTSAAINHSNTAATLAAAMDIAMSGLSGFPAPVATALRLATKHIKDNKVRARVTQALKPRSTKE